MASAKGHAGVQGYPTFSRPPPDAPPPPGPGSYGGYGGPPAPQLRPPAPQPSQPSAAPTTRSVPLEKVRWPYCYLTLLLSYPSFQSAQGRDAYTLLNA